MPLISVIMPVFNTEPYLAAAVDAVLNQRLQDIELICIDDGSTDHSADILGRYAAADPRVRVLHQANAGPGAARNAGMAIARGTYLYCFDSDDLLEPQALELAVAEAEQHGLDALWFGARSFGAVDMLQKCSEAAASFDVGHSISETMTGLDFLVKKVKEQRYGCSPCLYLVRRQLLVEKAIRFPVEGLHEDNLFTFHVCLAAQRVRERPDRWFLRRVRPGSIMTSRSVLANYTGCLTGYVGMASLAMRNAIAPHAFPEVHSVLELMKLQALNRLSHAGVRAAAEQWVQRVSEGLVAYVHFSLCRQLDGEHRAFEEGLVRGTQGLEYMPPGAVPDTVMIPAVGMIDEFWRQQGGLMVRGWALAWNRLPVHAVVLSDGRQTHVSTGWQIQSRPDVLTHYPGADPLCGFVARVEAPELDTSCEWTVSALPRCGGRTGPLFAGQLRIKGGALGCIDQIQSHDGGYRAEGWALVDGVYPVESLRLRSGDTPIEVRMIGRRARPDVQACYPQAALESGFSIEFALGTPELLEGLVLDMAFVEEAGRGLR